MIRVPVPCNGCTACCRDDLIVLHPECGDDPAAYETEEWSHMIVLKHKPDGSCIYLGDGGCTIWERAPTICREFDCRQMYRKLTRAERRRLVKAGLISQEVLNAGRDRS